MTSTATVVPLLIFEAADCLMAVPASEISHLEKTCREGSRPLFSEATFDLGEYFSGCESDGPWLQWARGTRQASLRVNRVVDVVPTALSSLTPMPMLLRGQRCSGAFLAAGVNGADVFLLLDPARLGNSSVGASSVGRDFSRAKTV